MFFYYPISAEQVIILNYLHLSGNVSLWLLRIASFLVLFAALRLWFKLISHIADKQIAIVSIIAIGISPAIWVVGMVYPLVCIKLLLFTLGMYFVSMKKYWWLVALVLVLFNINIIGNNPAIFNKLSIKDAQIEVTHRISTEDSLKNDLKVSLWWRRVSYNKYFFTYKQVLAETLPFFDFESIFFQEINPLAQKSVVIFYWPEMFLLVFSFYFLVKNKNNSLSNLLFVGFLTAGVSYVFSEGAVYLRLILVMFPISLLLGMGYVKLPKFVNILLTLFVVFGAYNAINDLNVRSDYWLDNRPLAFEFWYREIDKLDLTKYNKIQVSSLVGDAKQYCYFYLGKICDDKKFEFNSFDLSLKSEKSTLYAGFAGEFVGSRFKNDIDSGWDKNALIDIVAKKSLRDTIAYKYGNDLGVGYEK
ncbi:MAG: hypothetical protein WC069_02365 [Candidatus Shapirobacteria bacterium]